uniref:Serine/threonine kinase 31 n=1 Tax=Leptobrachium leishanense TaxID=445787 RepID=A0A8C5M604_9ANUR
MAILCLSVENVYVSHVEDAVTFWAQPLTKIHDISNLSDSLADVCQSMNTMFGIPDLDKIYAGLFSADKCWYRCKIQYVINDDQCAVTYIDYGNSEILDRSSIVELPDDLQFPAIAQKYRLWGLQLKTRADTEQGLKFLASLIAEKQISVQQKATYKDGTVIVHVEQENLDIGEEMVTKGFAEKCRAVSSPNHAEDTAEDQESNSNQPFAWKCRKMERLPMREPKSFPMLNKCAIDQKAYDFRKEISPVENLPSVRLKNHTEKPMGDGIRIDKKMLDENKQLKSEKETLLQKIKALEERIQRSELQYKKEKVEYDETIQNMEESLKVAVGNKLKILTSKIGILKTVRHGNENVTVGDDLLEAISVVTEERISAPASMNELEENWTEYICAQEKIRSCADVVYLDELLAARNQIRQTLYSSVELYTLEVDELPLDGRQSKLQALMLSLQAAYGPSGESEGLDSVFDTFFKWKQVKNEQFNCVRSDTNNSLNVLSAWFYNIEEFFELSSDPSTSEFEVVGNIDEILDNVESVMSKELEVSLLEQKAEDWKIITNAYNRVVELIHQELTLISVIQSKYSASTEFKKNVEEWLDKDPNINHLMSIKKNIKRLKAQLRWKIVERSTLEEADECNESTLAELNNDISVLRNDIFSEISQEREEYGALSILVQKWFPELPLIYPEAGILRYMKSGGLLSDSMERDLLDAKPMKELSSKRPLVWSDVQNKQVLLKGYSVGLDTEEKVIERASKYHEAWRVQKEESGIMELIYLFFCKADPLLYLMVPFYPGESLSSLQANTFLNSKEILNVMRGVAEGLHTLHHANIIIGSLHESNVFAINRQKGIIGDLDFTKDAEQRSIVTCTCFPHLTAPELKLGLPPSESSDLYAYGCILLWLSLRKREFALTADGTPDVNDIDLDVKLKDLLSRLFCREDRIPSDQVRAHEYFQLCEETVTMLPSDEKDVVENTPADFA